MSNMSRKDCICSPVLASLHLSRLRGEVISHRKMRYGWGLSPYEECDARRHPHPNPPPQAGEGAHLLCGDYSTYSSHAHTPRYACLTVSVCIMSAEVPDERMVPASSR